MTAYQPLPATPPRPSTARIPPAIATYDLAWLDRNGGAVWASRDLPATPPTDAAVSVLGRSATLQRRDGPVAVEDLTPGDHVAVHGGGTARIDWIGARVSDGRTAAATLYRVAAGTFAGRFPTQDTVLGQHAHILIDSPACRPIVGGSLAFAPVEAFADGHSVIALAPPGEIVTYGIACAGQEAILVAGLPVESQHPVRLGTRNLTRSAPAEMARLFPQMADTAGFRSPRIPCLTAAEAADLALDGF